MFCREESSVGEQTLVTTIVQLDLPMGVGAKLAQNVTAHTAAFVGYPTSMNQALIGGVAGAGSAQGLQTLNRKAMSEIIVSWFLTPVVAGIVSFCLYTVCRTHWG
jgi:phosphate/sulfate permease